MKKVIIFVLSFLLGIALLGCNNGVSQPTPQIEENEQAAMVKVVEDFGSKLQAVSLLAPEEILKKSMQENYSAYVSPELLAAWQKDPQNAPGRLTSSPWPDRIEIQTTEKSADAVYEVKGEVIEITSVEKEKGGFAAKRPITLKLEKRENSWLITAVTLGQYQEQDPQALVYTNTQYGFTFSLPKSWQGYSIVYKQWEGHALGGAQDGKVVEKGDLLSIRHPAWTAQNPRQDIPIMVLTLDQWNLVQQEKLSLGAAPIGPKELARNSKYVFAIPARYNYAFPTGFEEVEQILAGNPLRARE